jgi:TPR repeat protein
MYRQGIGGFEQNNKKAIELYKKSAKQGFSKSTYKLMDMNPKNGPYHWTMVKAGKTPKLNMGPVYISAYNEKDTLSYSSDFSQKSKEDQEDVGSELMSNSDNDFYNQTSADSRVVDRIIFKKGRGSTAFAKGDNQPFTGKFIKRYGGGQKEIETSYISGKKHGIEIYWFEDGGKWKVYNWEKGVKNGIQSIWSKWNNRRMYDDTYNNGKLVSRNNLSVYWYRKEAELGDPEAQFKLGETFKGGTGRNRDHSKAIKWWSKAAKQGHAKAQFSLGYAYYYGDRVDKNNDLSIYWLKKSAKNGYKSAKNYLRNLHSITLVNDSDNSYQQALTSDKSNNLLKSSKQKLKSKKSFSDLWGQYGGSTLDSDSSYTKQQSNFTSTANADTKAPEIYLNQSIFLTVHESQVQLSGVIKDSSKISELTIFGSSVPIDKSGKFNTTLYVPLGKSNITIEALDVFGNKSGKVVTIVRNKAVVKNKDKRLIPPTTMMNSNPNAVALIIGVDKYESITSAPWAESDARSFYDYAQNVLGISTDKIRLITGSDSSEAGIWKSVERWLPTMVDRNKSDVYLYFAGHGLASADGNNAYLIPWDGDPDLLARTAILRSELIDGLKDLNAANVTLFMDTCYSGKARGGKGTLVADSRGLRIVKKDTLYNLPDNFTLFSAAANDETASSHKVLEHGLFSYWVMQGLGGDADSNSDRKITNGELHAFIDKNVQKSAAAMGRKQHPQLVGDKDKVITSW